MNKNKGKVEEVFDEFKKNYECINNHTWGTYKKTFYLNKGKLK